MLTQGYLKSFYTDFVQLQVDVIRLLMEDDDSASSRDLDAQNPYDRLLALDTSSVDSNCNLDSVSAIYLAMKSSKLECVDERGQDSLITSVCMEDEEDEELDEFDPYLFIKNLPNLSSVVPTFRPVLLPKQTRSCPPISLVLDLDGKATFQLIRLFAMVSLFTGFNGAQIFVYLTSIVCRYYV